MFKKTTQVICLPVLMVFTLVGCSNAVKNQDVSLNNLTKNVSLDQYYNGVDYTSFLNQTSSLDFSDGIFSYKISFKKLEGDNVNLNVRIIADKYNSDNATIPVMQLGKSKVNSNFGNSYFSLSKGEGFDLEYTGKVTDKKGIIIVTTQTGKYNFNYNFLKDGDKVE